MTSVRQYLLSRKASLQKGLEAPRNAEEKYEIERSLRQVEEDLINTTTNELRCPYCGNKIGGE